MKSISHIFSRKLKRKHPRLSTGIVRLNYSVLDVSQFEALFTSVPGSTVSPGAGVLRSSEQYDSDASDEFGSKLRQSEPLSEDFFNYRNRILDKFQCALYDRGRARRLTRLIKRSIILAKDDKSTEMPFTENFLLRCLVSYNVGT